MSQVNDEVAVIAETPVVTTNVADFDLSSLSVATNVVEDAIRVPVIFNSDGEERAGFLIHPDGKNSSLYRKEKHNLRVSGLHKSAKRTTRLSAETEEGAEVLASLLETNEFRLANSVVVGWFGFSDNGVKAEFDKTRATQLLKDRPTWVEIISEKLDVEANFIKG